MQKEQSLAVKVAALQYFSLLLLEMQDIQGIVTGRKQCQFPNIQWTMGRTFGTDHVFQYGEEVSCVWCGFTEPVQAGTRRFHQAPIEEEQAEGGSKDDVPLLICFRCHERPNR